MDALVIPDTGPRDSGPSCVTMGCPPLAHATGMCVGTVCVYGCAPGFDDCDATSPDCESDLTGVGSCGMCGRVCAAGESCTAGACVRPPMDTRSCRALLAGAPGTPSGTYPIDPDGPGGAAGFTAYCDMTTAGGGWTLTYKIRNDIPQGAGLWWDMVMPGSGTTFPTALTRPGGVSEGPDSATRAALTSNTGATEWRATMRRDATGEVLVDVRSSYTGDPARGFRCFAAGTCTSEPSQSCSPSPSDATVISTTFAGVGAGGTGHLCDIGWTACAGCVDWAHVSATPSMSTTDAMWAFVGDDYIAHTDTTTYFWIR